MGPICCTETSARNCHYLLRNIPEDSSHLLRGGSLKSLTVSDSCVRQCDIQLAVPDGIPQLAVPDGIPQLAVPDGIPQLAVPDGIPQLHS